MIRCSHHTLVFAIACLLSASAAQSADKDSTKATAPTRKTPWSTSKVQGTPEPPSPFLAERRFPKLKFTNPVEMRPIPGTNRLLVMELGGKIYSFPDRQEAASPDLALDLKQHKPAISNAYGFTFHPDFKRNRTCFISYIQGPKETGTKVCRYRFGKMDPPTIDPASREEIFNWPSGGHNGAAMRFGPDGYLYITAGDGVGPNPPDPTNNGQDCSNYFSTLIRIDVDHVDEGRKYRIPQDNPFINTQGVLPEIWAYGFRNPWKLSFDRKTGDLFVSDVGWELWEFIYQVQKGGNYGWSIVEGRQPVNTQFQRGPTPILPPTVDHPHSEAASITGGEFYYGTRLPTLRDQYVYGDYETGKLWSFGWDPKKRKVLNQRELVDTSLRVICFSYDTQDDLLFMDYAGGTIHRLAPNPQRGRPSRFPKKLSQTGLFASTQDHQLAPGVVGYNVAAPPWHDGATAERAIAVPGTAPVSTSGKWQVPAGTVLLKTLSLDLATSKKQPTGGPTRIETQILHWDGDAWRGYGYRWNPQGTDADLVDTAGADVHYQVKNPENPARSLRQTWHFASRVECVRCHNPWAGHLLGFNATGLDRTSPGTSDGTSQLATLTEIGLLHPPVKGSKTPPLADPYDASAPTDKRARSFLHINCSHCHRLHAGSSVLAYMHHDLSLPATRMIDAKPSQGTFGIRDARIVAPGDPLRSVLYLRVSKIGRGRMPHIGSEVVDRTGATLVRDWIASLEGADVPVARFTPAQRHTRLESRATVRALESAGEKISQDLLARALRSTSTALHLQHRLDTAGSRFSQQARRQIVTAAVASEDVTTRDLFERFIPEEQRVQRLGRNVKPAALLAIPGDAAAGRALFVKSTSVQCRNCHVVDKIGKAVGPTLDGVGKKYGRAELLDQILNPSRKIDPKYLTYVVETTAGKVFTGLLVKKTDSAIVLRDAKNTQTTIPAGEVEEIITQQKSMMPELLLKDMTAKQVADLLAFLSTLKAEVK
ncbi:MAG: hypothetical protein CMJ68_14725 [Planctomycetaceae bacterium]|nr:hypothetical protein [Planctomycetaceae bacterium]